MPKNTKNCVVVTLDAERRSAQVSLAEFNYQYNCATEVEPLTTLHGSQDMIRASLVLMRRKQYELGRHFVIRSSERSSISLGERDKQMKLF